MNAGLAAIDLERAITLVPEIDLGRVENQRTGAAWRAGAAASNAFAAAFATDAFQAPNRFSYVRLRGMPYRRQRTVVMNITTPDTNGFRQSQGQIAADAARAIARA